jgi:colicin import membrane protein
MKRSAHHPHLDELDSYRMVFSSASISVVLHIIMIAALLLVPDHATSSRDFSSSVISVSMVSLDPEPPPLVNAGPDATDTAAPEMTPEIPLVTAEDMDQIYTEAPEVTQPEAKPDAMSEKPAEPETPTPVPDQGEQVVIENAQKNTPEPQTPSSEEEPPPEKTIKAKLPNPQAYKPKMITAQAISPENLQTDSIKDAISQIRKKNVREATRPLQRYSERVAHNGVPGGTGSRGGVPGHISEIYRQQIKYHVEQNWAFPSHLANSQKKYKGTILLTILPSGHIKEVWFEQKSGLSNLDSSVYRAVMKSNPMPPLPKGYTRYTIGLRYDSSGLN